jgi:FkbM family methyltransferase
VSDFNISWFVENFANRKLTIFDIGCADLSDSIRLRRYLPDSTIYAFECAERWQQGNKDLCVKYDINYHNIAVSDYSGKQMFWPTLETSNAIDVYAGTLCDVDERFPRQENIFDTGVLVETIGLNDFCRQQSVVPDFIHIDVEGMELRILQSISTEFEPWLIWAENHYDRKIYQQLLEVMQNKGYNYFNDEFDTLFSKKNIKFSSYQSLRFEKDQCVDLKLCEKEFIQAYQTIKDPTWPIINDAKDFASLNKSIKQECLQNIWIDPVLIDQYPTIFNPNIDYNE